MSFRIPSLSLIDIYCMNKELNIAVHFFKSLSEQALESAKKAKTASTMMNLKKRDRAITSAQKVKEKIEELKMNLGAATYQYFSEGGSPRFLAARLYENKEDQIEYLQKLTIALSAALSAPRNRVFSNS